MLYETIGYILVSVVLIYAIHSCYQYIQQSYTTPTKINLVKLYEQKYNRLWEDHVQTQNSMVNQNYMSHLPSETQGSMSHVEPTFSGNISMRDSLYQMVRDADFAIETI